MWKRNWTIFGRRKLLSMTSRSELWILTLWFSFRLNSFYTALIISAKINLNIVFFLLSVPSSAPGCYSRGESNVCSFNNRTNTENKAGWDASVLYLKWEARESCSMNNSRDGSFTHKLKQPLAINLPMRTSMDSIRSFKQHFYDYKTIISLGLFSLFHLLETVSKIIVSCQWWVCTNITWSLVHLKGIRSVELSIN